MSNDWLSARVEYLRGLKAPSEQQRLLLLLAEKPERTADDERKLTVLVRAEKAADRAARAKADASRILNADKVAERKARDRELYNVAGLLILGGLVNSRSGTPMMDRGELLGALASLSKVSADDPRRAEWKKVGDKLLAGK